MNNEIEKISIDEFKNADKVFSYDDCYLIWFKGDKEFFMVQKSINNNSYTIINTIFVKSQKNIKTEMLDYIEHLKSQDDFNKYMYKREFDTVRELMDEWKE